MKHSNIYYIFYPNPETGVREFIEVDGISVKNLYGLDLFRHKHPSKSHYVISEGKTGGMICEIRPDSTDSQYEKSHKNIDAYLGVYHEIDKYYKHERFLQVIEKMVEDGKLSPRYTEPDKRRVPKAKETNSDSAFSKCLYEKGKKYFIRIYNQDGIQLFKRKDSGNDSCFTVYVPSNGWMVSLGSAGSMDDYINPKFLLQIFTYYMPKLDLAR